MQRNLFQTVPNDTISLSRRLFVGGAVSMAVGMGSVKTTSNQALAYNRTTTYFADQLSFFFDHLALKHERFNQETVPGWVRKWQGAVHVRVRGLRGIQHLDDIDEALDSISSLTDYRFSRSPYKAGEGGIATIYYLSANEMRRIFGRTPPVCMTNTQGRGGRIFRGRISINESFADCLRHELMHLIGFDNHWPGHRIGLPLPSVLARRLSPERSQTFSVWDRLAARVLYDDRLEPGMQRRDALPVANAVINELFNTQS